MGCFSEGFDISLVCLVVMPKQEILGSKVCRCFRCFIESFRAASRTMILLVLVNNIHFILCRKDQNRPGLRLRRSATIQTRLRIPSKLKHIARTQYARALREDVLIPMLPRHHSLLFHEKRYMRV